jgi:hypothetical protein
MTAWATCGTYTYHSALFPVNSLHLLLSAADPVISPGIPSRATGIQSDIHVRSRWRTEVEVNSKIEMSVARKRRSADGAQHRKAYRTVAMDVIQIFFPWSPEFEDPLALLRVITLASLKWNPAQNRIKCSQENIWTYEEQHSLLLTNQPTNQPTNLIKKSPWETDNGSDGLTVCREYYCRLDRDVA